MKKDFKIWHISDTHTYHELLKTPEDIDMIIFSGDCSNPRDPYKNQPEVVKFVQWFAEQPARYKIMIAGNHDSSIESRLITKEFIEEYGITYIENEIVEIAGYKIFGSPVTPSFNNWCFQKARAKTDKLWKFITDDVDIVVVHGPPKGILDIGERYDRSLERCGDSALFKRLEKVQPKLVCFGHIHNVKDIRNAGTLKLATIDTIFSNGSVVTDNKFGSLSSNGNIISL